MKITWWQGGIGPCSGALALVVLSAGIGCRAMPDTPLTEAAARGDVGMIAALLSQGSDVNLMDGEGWTPLMWAARNGETETIEMLLDSGAEADLSDSGHNGWTALMHALHRDRQEAAHLLIERGAGVNFRTAGGATPLMIATGDYETRGSPEMVRALIDRGADPHAPICGRSAVLVNAVAWGRTEIVRVLLEKAPDLKMPETLSGRMATLLARLRGDSEILALLRQADAGRGAGTVSPVPSALVPCATRAGASRSGGTQRHEPASR